MNKVENLSELATAYQLAKNPPSALDLLLAYEKKLLTIRKYLLLELREPGVETRIALPRQPRDLTDLIRMLACLVNDKRLKSKQNALSIIY